MTDYAPMSDFAMLGLLTLIAPVLLFGLLANFALWFDRPLPYDEEYEQRQREDRKLAARRLREALKAQA